MRIVSWPGRCLALLTGVVVTACGGDDASVAVDAAAEIDAEVEVDAAGDPDAADPAPVTVRARTSVGPAAGVLVAFLDGSDAVIATAITGGNGEASAIVPSGGKVLATRSSTSREGSLWVGVEPGDVLEMLAGSGNPATVTTTIVVPAVAGTSLYAVASPCSTATSSTPTISLNYDDRPGCAIQDLIVTRSGTGGDMGFYVANQALVAGGTLDLAAQTFVVNPTRTVSVVNLPATSTSGELRGTLFDDGHAIGYELSANLADGVAAGSDSRPIVHAPTIELLTRIQYADGGNTVTISRLGPQDDGVLDVATTRPRLIASASYVDATETLTWTETSTGQVPHGIYARITYGPPALFGGNYVVWNVLAPDIGSLVMPTIPAELSVLDVGARSFARVDLNLVVHADGFGAVRSRAFAIEDSNELLGPSDWSAVAARAFLAGP